jgi:predicted nucleic acid-binding protein
MTASDLDLALGDREQVLLDSSTLIAYHDPAEAVHPLARHVLGRVSSDQDGLRGDYSMVSAAELFVRPIRTGRDEFTFMHDFLLGFPNLTGLPFDMMVAIQAATLRATMRLPFADAAVIAAGMLAGCEAIVTNDERWKRRGEPLFPQFRWIYLDDYR